MRTDKALPFAFAAIGITTLLVLAGSRRRPAVGIGASAIVDEPLVDVGLRIEGKRIVVESYDRLFAFLPAAFEDARRDGIRGAEQILASAIRRALPRHAWPPPVDSVLTPQWRELVSEVAKVFEQDDDPIPTRRLKLV